jgi:programmed cell death 6-interacting protein
MGLPGSIEAAESPSGVPAALLQKMSTVRIEGGVRMLNEQTELLDKVAGQDDSLLKDSVGILDSEEKEDTEMRAQFGNRWNRTPSHALTAALRQEAQKFIGNLEHARKSDDFVRQKLRTNADAINKLSWPAEKIVAELPSDNSSAGASPQSADSVATLKQLVGQMTALLQNRENLLQQLKDRVNKDDITPKLLQTTEAEQESLFAKEIFKFNDTIEAIKATFPEQAQLIVKIQQANEAFVRLRQTNSQMEQRQNALQSYEQAFKMYGELKSHIKEGIQFYTKFQEIVAKFKVKCSDFAFARKTELSDLVTDLQTPAPAPQPTTVPSSNPMMYNPAAAMAATPYAAPAPQAFAQASYQLVQPQQQHQQQPQMVSMMAPPPYGAQQVQFIPTMMAPQQQPQQPQRPQQPAQYFVYPGQLPPGY